MHQNKNVWLDLVILHRRCTRKLSIVWFKYMYICMALSIPDLLYNHPLNYPYFIKTKFYTWTTDTKQKYNTPEYTCQIIVYDNTKCTTIMICKGRLLYWGIPVCLIRHCPPPGHTFSVPRYITLQHALQHCMTVYLSPLGRQCKSFGFRRPHHRDNAWCLRDNVTLAVYLYTYDIAY